MDPSRDTHAPLSDTSPEAERVLLELYRGMDPDRKLRLIFELQETVDDFARSGIRMRHPQASEREVVLRLAALKLPRELMIAAFGWDPRERGY